MIEIINSLPMEWYVDQVALKRLLVEHLNLDDVVVFNGHLYDWNFFEGTAIWTGKGKSKTDNPRYVAMKQKDDSMKLFAGPCSILNLKNFALK